MSYIEKLLNGVTVEWKTLGEVVEIIRGVRITKNDLLSDGKYPVVSGGIGYMGYTNNYNRESNTITIAQYGTAGYVKWQTEKFWANDVCFCVKPNTAIILNRYLYFYLINKQQYIYDISNRTATPYSIERDKILKLEIPIPALEIQQKIVAILDSFTELTVELTVELTARQKQYQFYREQLLSFDEGKVEWKTLGEVGEIKRGVAFTKKQAVFGKFPVVANSAEPISFHNEFNRNGEFIVIARSGANAGLVSYWNEELFLTDAFSIHPNNSVLNTKFAFYFFKKHQREIHLMKEGSGVPHVRAADFEIYKIPIPPLEEQERIVTILDKFDILTNSMSEGLPKEIELRKKQYEYYRDLLLTFPKDNLKV